MATIAVTGGTGHIGGVLVHRLVELGHDVRVLSYKGERGLSADLPNVQFIDGDIRDRDSLRGFLDGAEQLFHLAAQISIDGDLGGLVPAINVDGAAAVAETALEIGVGRMVHFASIHAFDQHPTNEPLDETRQRATAGHHLAYDQSKALGELRVREVIARGLDAVIVHPTGVIGPMDAEPSRMGRVWLDLYHRRLPALVDGHFNWVDARDVVEGALAAMEKGRTGESYILGGHHHSVTTIADMAEAATGVKRPGFVTPMPLARIFVPLQAAFDKARGKIPVNTSEALKALSGNRDMRIDKARQELGYNPRPTEDSVRDIYAWFEQNGYL